MDGAEEDNRWPPRRVSGTEQRAGGVGGRAGRAEGLASGAAGRGSALRLRGPQWVVSLRALVVVLAMLVAALGMLWLEAAGVEGVSAELATKNMGQVAVPPLGNATPGSSARPSAPQGSSALSPPNSTAAPPPGTQVTPPVTSVGPSGSSGPPSDTVLLVHVAGAVANPGVVRLSPGSRVYQAIEAAGGALSAAALSALNLAAPIEDGQQVLVPTAEEAALAQGSGASGTAEHGQAAVPGGAQRSPQQPLNINTATAAELETLPGVGPVLAERIVTWRNDHGPYTSVDALDAVSGIGAKMLAGIRELVRVS